MNLLIILTASSVFANILASGFRKEYLEEVQGYCKSKESASDEDLNNILNGTLPETRAEKCLGACLDERYGTVSEKEKTF